MNCKYTNLQKELIEKCVLCFIPKNKRGFSSQFEMVDIFKCIVHKLKTGCQWSFLFIDLECCYWKAINNAQVRLTLTPGYKILV